MAKGDVEICVKLIILAPWAIMGLTMSSPFIGYRLMVDKNSDKWESVPRFAMGCALFGPISPLYSIPYTLCNLRPHR